MTDRTAGRKASPEGTRTILVYGSFNEPKTDLNFILVRYPDGRVPWSRRIAPALDRMIRDWFTPEQKAAARRERRERGGSDIMFWNAEGIEDDAWEDHKGARYQWDGERFNDVPRA